MADSAGWPEPPNATQRYFLAHREAAAFWAICFRRLALNLCARALPPLSPPSRPSATAAGFRLSSASGERGAGWPLAWATMRAAAWFMSWSSGGLLGPRGETLSRGQRRRDTANAFRHHPIPGDD